MLRDILVVICYLACLAGGIFMVMKGHPWFGLLFLVLSGFCQFDDQTPTSTGGKAE